MTLLLGMLVNVGGGTHSITEDGIAFLDGELDASDPEPVDVAVEFAGIRVASSVAVEHDPA
jgi:hypothetical protein